MNVVGKIGELIIDYQYEIEIALLVLLALIIVVSLVRAIVRSTKRKNMLKEIDSKVSNISEKLDHLGEKQENAGTERVDTKEYPPIDVEKKEPLTPVVEKVEAPEEKAEITEEPANNQSEEESAKEFQANPAAMMKYYSRDWGTDKHGNVYTEDLLNEQIH